MGNTTPPTTDLEQDRQGMIQKWAAEEGPEWADNFRPGTPGCHELLDRSLLAAEFLENTVLQHPACLQNQEWFELANRAVTILQDLYQRVGAKHLNQEITQ